MGVACEIPHQLDKRAPHKVMCQQSKDVGLWTLRGIDREIPHRFEGRVRHYKGFVARKESLTRTMLLAVALTKKEFMAKTYRKRRSLGW